MRLLGEFFLFLGVYFLFFRFRVVKLVSCFFSFRQQRRKKMKLVLLVVVLAFVASGQALNCSVPDVNKEDCGYDGITQSQCENTGCCWQALNPNPNNYPWCFKPGSPSPPVPSPPVPPPSLNCAPNRFPRTDCGYDGITQGECEGKGCCWTPATSDDGDNVPWCYDPNGPPAPSPTPFPTPIPPPPPPGTPPFSPAEVNEMMGYFLANINIDGSGAVVASPDTTTPGGSYYYHWMRDAALSMRTLMITNNDTSVVDPLMQSYVQWVLNVQSENDPNNIDVRVEPKFDIPSGTPYNGGWCRPQTDGPGLRGGTNALYAIYLLNHTGASYVKEYLYTGDSSKYHGGAIKYDLDWVATNWQSSGCDLWEEVQSTDFFWNRYNFRYGLTVGAMVADRMGDSATASKWRSVASQIQSTILNHYNGQYVYESTNREKDTAVICGFNDGYLNDGFLAPTDYRVSGTISTLNDVFNSMFPINGKDTRDGYGGILYGRYEGDQYAGGNPWILSTAALAQLYYNGAKESLERRELPSPRALKDFKKIFGIAEETVMDYKSFAKAAVQAGDDVLYRLRYHTESYDFHMSEQLDKNTGVEISATDLTWSYACVLKAMHYRNQTQNGLI